METIQIKVTETDVIIKSKPQKITANNIEVIKCEFELDEAFSDLIVRAVFDGEYRTIENNICYAPPLHEGICEIGVYGYEVENDNYKLLISPQPVRLAISKGSYNPDEVAADNPAPSELEAHYFLVEELIGNAEELIGDAEERIKEYADYVEENAEKVSEAQQAAVAANSAAQAANTAAGNIGADIQQTANGAIITITDSDGTERTANISNGAKGETGATGPQGPKGDTGAQGPAGADAPVVRTVYEGTGTHSIYDFAANTIYDVKNGFTLQLPNSAESAYKYAYAPAGAILYVGMKSRGYYYEGSLYPESGTYLNPDILFFTMNSGVEAGAVHQKSLTKIIQTLNQKQDGLTAGTGITISNNVISADVGLHFQVVQNLPSTGNNQTIYLKPNSGSGRNIYDEYIYVNNAWEKIGSTEIDLSQYVTNTDFENSLTGIYNDFMPVKYEIVSSLPSSNISSKTVYLIRASGYVFTAYRYSPITEDWENEGAIDFSSLLSSLANVQPDWNESDSSADGYIKNKPTIPAAVTESTVSGWGFTKNTGTYSKPSGGIPKTDLASAVLTSLGKADTAIQEHQSLSAYALKTELPTKTSDLSNDSHFAVDANYVHTDNNFSSAEKTKLSGIAAGAEVNVQPDWNVTDSSSDAFIKNKPTIPVAVTVDSAMSSSSTNPVQNKVIKSALDNKSDAATTYSKTEVDNLISEAIADVSDLIGSAIAAEY